jgi:hypothetical protein
VRKQLRTHLSGFKRCIEDAAVEAILAQMAKGAKGLMKGTGTGTGTDTGTDIAMSPDDQKRLAAVEQLMEKVNLKEGLAARVAVAEERMRQLRAQLAWRTEALVKAGKQHSLLTTGETGARSPVKHKPEVAEAVQRTLELRRSVLSVSQELEATEREFMVASGDMEMADLEISASLRRQGAASAATDISSGGGGNGDVVAQDVDPSSGTAVPPVEAASAGTAEDENEDRDTDAYPLAAVLAGEAVVVRHEGEPATAYRRRLERRLASLTRLEVQVEGDVARCTDALRVARDELRDVEVLRLRLELQVQHLQTMLDRDADDDDDDDDDGAGAGAGAGASTPTANRKSSGMTPIPERGGGPDGSGFGQGLNGGVGDPATTPTVLAGYPSVPYPSRIEDLGISGNTRGPRSSSTFNPPPTARATAPIGIGTELGFEDSLARGLADDAVMTGPVTGLKAPKPSSSPPIDRRLVFGASEAFGADDDEILAKTEVGANARRRKEETAAAAAAAAAEAAEAAAAAATPTTAAAGSSVTVRLRVLVDSLAQLQLRIDATRPGPGPQCEADTLERTALAALLQAQQMELTLLLQDVHADTEGGSPAAAASAAATAAAATATATATAAATSSSSSSSSSSSKLQRRDGSPACVREGPPGQGDRRNGAVIIFKAPALGANVSEPTPSPYGNHH